MPRSTFTILKDEDRLGLGVQEDGAAWLTEARQMLDFNLKRLAHRARSGNLEGVRLEAGTLIVAPTAGEVPAAAEELNAEISELYPLVEVAGPPAGSARMDRLCGLLHDSPLSWEHTNLTGIYSWDSEQHLPEGFPVASPSSWVAVGCLEFPLRSSLTYDFALLLFRTPYLNHNADFRDQTSDHNPVVLTLN